ncbi:MAG: hypothetical protein ACYDAO_08485 [Thermoplasmataceae archaeon]
MANIFLILDMVSFSVDRRTEKFSTPSISFIAKRKMYMLRCYDVYMLKRTTITLDSSIYEELVKESVSKYGDARHLSVIINEKLRKSNEDYSRLFQMAKRKKTHKENIDEFESFRSDLSKEFES